MKGIKMRIEIEKPKEKEIGIARLIESCNYINLCIDVGDNRYTIAFFRKEGEEKNLLLAENIPSSLGFSTDKRGRVETE